MPEIKSNIHGIGWMLLAVAVWSVMMVLVRALSAEYTSFQILFIRTVVGLLMLFPLLRRSGLRTLRTRRFPLHLLRSGFAYCGMLGLFIGIGEIPLAEVVSLSFTQPIFIVVLATILLGEKLGGMRLAATLGGFSGVLVILRPGFEEIGFGVSVRVHPTLVPRSHPLAAVHGANNAVFVEAEAAGSLMFYGAGAGGA